MNILQVISSFPPAYSYGGPVRMAYETSKYLVKKGHKVTVYTTDVYDSKSRLKYYKNPTIMEGIKVYRFKNISNQLAKRNLTIAPTIIFSLIKNIRNFDIIHLHEYRTLQSKLVTYYAKKYGVPYILQPRGSASIIGKDSQKKIFDLLLGNDIFYGANKIIASSKIESDQYVKIFSKFDYSKIIYIPNPIDFEIYNILPKKLQFRNKYHIKSDEKIILFLGRLHKIKGVELLIYAFSEIKKKHPQVKLVISGPDENNLQQLKLNVRKLNLDKDVVFSGPLYNDNKLEAYVDADIFVLPSFFESFGNVALEACACGLPTIITNKCGVSEWLNNVSYIIDCDISQLKNALETLLNDESLCEKLAVNSKQYVLNNFNWDIISSKIEKVYIDVLKNQAQKSSSSYK